MNKNVSSFWLIGQKNGLFIAQRASDTHRNLRQGKLLTFSQWQMLLLLENSSVSINLNRPF
jgi:hypothetical protein